ncbi:MAG: twin-arginine translocase TatA/TatE family subunit [Actinobacteria bacterium]|nr:twin-arginine translocase TatA/TatE family subunit [Actinomycetota bacterium]MBU4241556.1 twin-arginine translocase TatA/TatE family subunit [Actinomycetota bacterium]MBU4301219.1 twin-arginine translocase TatA/TatE family subunit [Actinomycetota bacterium]MBU4489148.1 twin-arginine translocase TatA/TatE family subunit [Actinomycetota bacterium]MCG2795259.1 twin-arginine translocase TatA/TatE family subunit [Actinomycetes bacterium]
MFGLGPTELIIILVIALVIFGPSRLPKVGQSVGQALRAFRDSTSSIEEEVKKSLGESTSDDESKE